MKSKYLPVAKAYAESVVNGDKIAGKEVVQACQRFLDDLQREDLEMRPHDVDLAINIMQKTLVHRQGEDMDGNPLQGKPFILQPFQIFIVCNLLGFYYTGTNERRYKEAFIMLGRKNGKTALISGLAWSVAIIQRHSGSRVYIVANALKQTMEAFQFITYSLRHKKLDKLIKISDNSFNHTIEYEFKKPDGTPDGSINITAMPANPDSQDSFNCNFAIADEMASYRKSGQYTRFKEAQKGYRNKLMIGITTAGDNANSFGYGRMDYAIKVVNGTVKDDSLFSFVARADQDANGDVDFTNPIQHEKANPNYGVTIAPKDILNESLQALNDPTMRKDFLSRSLNIYTTAMKSWFDIEEFRRSDQKYNWTLEELAKLPIDWYGGADLSRTYDLTATALYGTYQGVDIVITHGFFPITQANVKADEDGIPLFGWMDDGWLTMCNSPTINMGDVVGWFLEMKKKGFKIKEVGHDRKFAGEEYFPAMKKAGFKVIDQPQYYYLKSQGFRHIEKSAKDGKLYYLHSEAYEYCVSNVKAVEKTDDAVQYEKINPSQRIDLFDASVFACIRWAEASTKASKVKGWFG